MRIGDVEGSELEPECDAAGKLLAEEWEKKWKEERKEAKEKKK